MNILPTRKTYTSCEDLPLANFIKIVCDGELKHLYSEPPNAIRRNANLIEIWERIFNEYNELTQSTQSQHVFQLVKEITTLHSRIHLINDCVKLLLSVPDITEYQPTIDVLKSFGCWHVEITNENRQESLSKCVSICKKYVIDLMEAEKQYLAMNKDDGKKTTVNDFYSSIAHLSKFMGFPIPLHTTTVSLYISYINQFKASIPKDGK